MNKIRWRRENKNKEKIQCYDKEKYSNRKKGRKMSHKKEDGKQKQWKRDQQGKRGRQKEKGRLSNDLKM